MAKLKLTIILVTLAIIAIGVGVYFAYQNSKKINQRGDTYELFNLYDANDTSYSSAWTTYRNKLGKFEIKYPESISFSDNSELTYFSVPAYFSGEEFGIAYFAKEHGAESSPGNTEFFIDVRPSNCPDQVTDFKEVVEGGAVQFGKTICRDAHKITLSMQKSSPRASINEDILNKIAAMFKVIK